MIDWFSGRAMISGTEPGMRQFENTLTHWGWVTHLCFSKLTIIDSDNGLSPGRCQAIIWTNAGILLIGVLRTNLSEISIGIQTFSFNKMHLKMSSMKWHPFCLSPNVLTHWGLNKIDGIFQMGFSNALFYVNYHCFIQISLKFISNGPMVQIMAWCHRATNHYLNSYYRSIMCKPIKRYSLSTLSHVAPLISPAPLEAKHW